MKVSWLIDAEMFNAYRDELVACIRVQQHEVKLIRPPSPPYRWDDCGCSYRETFSQDACVVTLGDIDLVTRVHRERRWTPGAFAAVDHFACSHYYCHFGQYLLNGKYLMLPFGELRRCKEFLFDMFGIEGRLFVRPDSPLKLFTGQVVGTDTFDADFEFMAFYEFPAESIVVVSSPQNIETEWRFAVAEKHIVAGSQYKRLGKNDYRPGYDAEAFALAGRIAQSEYQPDPVWVVDICRTAGGDYRLLEIGGFSFADLYCCDKNAVVAAVSNAAANVWEQNLDMPRT